ncbi:17409_t:CDS:2, partial [Entrophospora sp. SA101]
MISSSTEYYGDKQFQSEIDGDVLKYWNLCGSAFKHNQYAPFILFIDRAITDLDWVNLKIECVQDQTNFELALEKISSLKDKESIPQVVKIISMMFNCLNDLYNCDEEIENAELPKEIIDFVQNYVKKNERFEIPVEYHHSGLFELFVAAQQFTSCFL